MTETWARYAAFLRQPPELEIVWHDRVSCARAWLIINSLRGGAAGGGTRMRAGLEEAEVVYLAKAMELKFALTGPAIGGAKSGIDFDPADPRKHDVLDRWYAAIEPLLRVRYGTAGDLNVDEMHEVVPAVRRLGLRHPQEGIVRGHYRVDETGTAAMLSLLDRGTEALLDQDLGVAGLRLAVADTITGFGVAESVRRWCARSGTELDGLRVLLEGFGNVGAACGLYLARWGARIVAISDAVKALIEPTGLDAAALEALVRASRDRLLPEGDPRLECGERRRRFWDVPADAFVCAAISDTIDVDRLDALARNGVGLIVCGANHPFRERSVGSTHVQQSADARFAVLPDVLANCGRARAFGYLMEPGARAEAEPIFSAVASTIDGALDEIVARARTPRSGLLAATLDTLLDRISAE